MSSSSPSAKSCTHRNAPFRTITRNALPDEKTFFESLNRATRNAASSSTFVAWLAAPGSFSASHSSIRLLSTWRMVSQSQSSRSSTAGDFKFAGTFWTRLLYASVRYRNTAPSLRFREWKTTYLLKSNPSSYISRAMALGFTTSSPTYGCAFLKNSYEASSSSRNGAGAAISSSTATRSSNSTPSCFIFPISLRFILLSCA
mmetsp:Transcript_12361/g.41130  ORF Transcript_12361/g.41130 Transcript_12361/m.41130 type:complete len:201 (-) Transcript_12361:1945-2547(-)